jgi:WD40 repeat protein
MTTDPDIAREKAGGQPAAGTVPNFDPLATQPELAVPKDIAPSVADEQRILSTVQGLDPSATQPELPLPKESAPRAADERRILGTVPNFDPLVTQPELPPHDVAPSVVDEQRILGTMPETYRSLTQPGLASSEDIAPRMAEEQRGIGTVPDLTPSVTQPEPVSPQAIARGFNTIPDVDPSATQPELPPAPADGKKTANERFGHTIYEEPGAGAAPKTIEESQLRTDNFGTVEIDTSGLPGFTGQYDKSGDPRATIGTRGFSITGPDLAIRPRVLAEREDAPRSDADYELRGVLGRGGMGVVLTARQASIDRVVALKKINSSHASDTDVRRKFLTEAVVTGELEHPNIVPIYDVGKDEAGHLFYAMKYVKGTPWNNVILQRSLAENLEIFMKVADAAAFAHSHNVVHRDLKPENVMLGGFGEVLVMDWGLAVKLGTPAAALAGVGGTPAYMAPEMISSRHSISLASDVYLLGAILYEIVTGTAPHTGANVQECLVAVIHNEIVSTQRNDELVAIARKAMSTRPEDRHATVGKLQEAIRLYQSHSQSVLLSTRAEEDLDAAAGREDYEFYARALLGFQEAFELWQGNVAAKEGIAKTSLVYAERALSKENFDLAASLLDESRAEHIPLLDQIRAAQREHNARLQRLKTFKRIGMGLVATIFLVVSVACLVIRSEYLRAESARNNAEKSATIAKEKEAEAESQRSRAEAAKTLAQTAQKDAEREKNDAIAARKEEEAARKRAIEAKNAALAAKEKEKAAKDEAVAATEKEAYGAYIARIGLASAKIDENAFDMAGALLAECPPRFRNWEWGRLMHLCRQSDRTIAIPQRVETLSLSPDGKRLVTGGEGGSAQIFDAQTGRQIAVLKTGGQYVFAAAFSPDGRRVALGTNDSPAYLKIFDAQTGEMVWEYRSHKVGGEPARGHEDAILSVAWSHDGQRLLTSSYDNTARLWDLTTGEESRVFRGHDWWVWSAAFSPDERWIVTASQDSTAIVWDVASGEPRATFRGHVGPVYAAAFAPSANISGSAGSGRPKLPHALIASAGYDKRILLWSPDALRDFDYRGLVRNDNDAATVANSAGQRGVLAGHTAAVRAICFSPDGRLLASAGNDNSVRVWDMAARQIVKTLRGHGGRVHAVAFSPQLEGEGRRLYSAGHDQQVKVWDLHRYEEMRVIEVAAVDGHRDAILGADFSPNGDRIVTASRDRTARTWDRQGHALVEFKEGHEYLASTTACFPDGKRMLTAAVDSTIRIWDLTNGGQVAVFKQTGPSAAAAISHDGRWVLTGGDSDTAHPAAGARQTAVFPHSPAGQGQAVTVQFVSDEPLWPAKLWDAQSGRLVHILAAHRREVIAVAFSPDDSMLFTGDANGRGHLWNRASGASKSETQKLHSRAVTAAAFLPRGAGLLTASGDNTVAQWEVTALESRYVLTPRQLLRHPDAVTSMSVAPDGKHLITTCSDKIVRLWNLASGDVAAMILPDRDHVLRIFDSRAGEEVRRWREGELDRIRRQQRQLIEEAADQTGGSVKDNVRNQAKVPDAKQPGKLSSLEARTRQLAEEERQVLGTEEINSVAFSPSGGMAVTTATDGTVRLWDWVAGREIGSGPKGAMPAFRSASGQAWSTAFAQNESYLITVGGNDARLWDRATGQETMRFGPQGAVASAHFAPDGQRVVTASWDNTARIWNAATGRVELKLQGHAEYVNDAVFSRDGTRVLTASDDKTARLWDAKTGETLVVFRGHTQRLRSANLDCDPATGRVRKVVTASDDGTARIWDAGGHGLLELKGHDKAVLSAVFSLDGTRLLTGGDDNRAILWDAATGKQLLALDGHTAGVTSVAFSPDGLRALTGSRDNTVKTWELQTGKELLTLKGHGQEVTTVSFSPDQRSVLTGGLDGIWILWDAAAWR